MAQRFLSKQRFLNPRIWSVFHVEARHLHFRHYFTKRRGILYSYCNKNGQPTSKTMPTMCRNCTINIMGFETEFFPKRLFYSSTNNQRKILSSSAALNLPSVKQIEQFLSSKGIRFEHGHTSIVVACLSCAKKSESAGKKADLCMYINKTTGSHFCKNCGSSGSWRQFKGMMSEPATSDRNAVPSTEHVSSYTTPLVSSADTNTKALQLWKDSKPLVGADDHVKKSILEKFSIKKISEELLEKYQVHIAEHKFSEPDGTSKERTCIAFPWYDSSKSAVHGVKLFKVDQEEENSAVAMQPRLGVLGLFGWNTVPSDAKEVVLTLNEFDAIAVNQATSYPAISLPLGTHSLPPEVLPQLEQFERIILWFGDDVRSRQAANHFSKKLSIRRCHIVRPTCESPPAGALDALNKGLDLKELLTSSKPINHEKIATFQELRNEVYSEFVNADQVAGVKWSRFPKLNALLKGHRRGELTIFTGPTGAGKTTLLSEMSVDLCQQGVNTLWGSFEIRNVRLAKIMMNQFSGLDLQKNVQQFNYWADKFEMLPMYFMCFYGSQNISTVIETMAHAVYVFDIDHIVIDNLQFMTSNLRAEDRFSVQNHAISSLRSFASSKNVHVTLVIHPRKENDDVELQTASIFGTAKASQEADNVLILQDKKGKGEKYLQVTKNRFDGTVGRVPLEFVKSSLSMCGFGKKDTSFKKTNNSIKKSESQPKSSKIISDIDMINISNTPTIEKAAFTTQRVKTYSPGTMNLDSRISGGSKSDSNVSSEKGRTLNDNFNSSPSGAVDSGLVNPRGFEDGVRAFQGSLRDSIKSKSFKELGNVFPQRKVTNPLSSSPGKVGNVGQKSTERGSPLSRMTITGSLAAKKLGSLSSKIKNKNGMEERKVASLGRMKASTKLLNKK